MLCAIKCWHSDSIFSYLVCGALSVPLSLLAYVCVPLCMCTVLLPAKSLESLTPFERFEPQPEYISGLILTST